METQTEPNWAVPWRSEPCWAESYHAVEKCQKSAVLNRTVPYHAVENCHKSGFSSADTHRTAKPSAWCMVAILGACLERRNFYIGTVHEEQSQCSQFPKVWRIRTIDANKRTSVGEIVMVSCISIMRTKNELVIFHCTKSFYSRRGFFRLLQCSSDRERLFGEPKIILICNYNKKNILEPGPCCKSSPYLSKREPMISGRYMEMYTQKS